MNRSYIFDCPAIFLNTDLKYSCNQQYWFLIQLNHLWKLGNEFSERDDFLYNVNVKRIVDKLCNTFWINCDVFLSTRKSRGQAITILAAFAEYILFIAEILHLFTHYHLHSNGWKMENLCKICFAIEFINRQQTIESYYWYGALYFIRVYKHLNGFFYYRRPEFELHPLLKANSNKLKFGKTGNGSCPPPMTTLSASWSRKVLKVLRQDLVEF